MARKKSAGRKKGRTMDQSGLLSMTQAAEELGITLEGVRYAIKRGFLQAIEVGPFHLVPRQSLEYYAQNRPLKGWKKGMPRGPRKKKVKKFLSDR
jgi:hypothetical protein